MTPADAMAGTRGATAPVGGTAASRRPPRIIGEAWTFDQNLNRQNTSDLSFIGRLMPCLILDRPGCETSELGGGSTLNLVISPDRHPLGPQMEPLRRDTVLFVPH